MWDNKTFQQAKEKMQDSPKTSKTKTMVSLGIFAVAFVLMIVFQAIWSVALVFVSALIVGYAFITTGKSSPTNNEQILAFRTKENKTRMATTFERNGYGCFTNC